MGASQSESISYTFQKTFLNVNSTNIETRDPTCMQPCWALGVPLYTDSTYGNLSQGVRTPARVSPEKCDVWGCHWTPGAGQVPEDEDGDGGTEPSAGSSSAGGLCPLPPGAERGWILLIYLSPSDSQAAMFKTGMDFPVYPTSALLPNSNCVGFVFLSSYTSGITQCDMADGMILTHLCSCY